MIPEIATKLHQPAAVISSELGLADSDLSPWLAAKARSLVNERDSLQAENTRQEMALKELHKDVTSLTSKIKALEKELADVKANRPKVFKPNAPKPAKDTPPPGASPSKPPTRKGTITLPTGAPTKRMAVDVVQQQHNSTVTSITASHQPGW